MREVSEMERDELFLYVEALIKHKGFYSAAETWRQTALRIEKDDPEFACYLRRAEDRWDEVNY
ncbi:MAG: hypothetical protein QMD09_02520 [Desulfatibacillaceae bacterium]|nr:hypothetical protein [Desulfatibacillaceae bacterium]